MNSRTPVRGFRERAEVFRPPTLAGEIEKGAGIDRILGFGVMFTPALVVDGVVRAAGQVPSLEEAKNLPA